MSVKDLIEKYNNREWVELNTYFDLADGESRTEDTYNNIMESDYVRDRIAIAFFNRKSMASPPVTLGIYEKRYNGIYILKNIDDVIEYDNDIAKLSCDDFEVWSKYE